MEVSSSQQMYVFVLCLISGIACGVFFDVQRSLRKLSAAGRARTAIEDLVFAVVCTVTAIGMGFLFNKGQIRYYQVMGLISGALFYAAFLSRLTMKILKKTYAFLRKFIVGPIVGLIKIIVSPLIKIYSALKRFLSKLRAYLIKVSRALKSRKKHLKKRMKML